MFPFEGKQEDENTTSADGMEEQQERPSGKWEKFRALLAKQETHNALMSVFTLALVVVTTCQVVIMGEQNDIISRQDSIMARQTAIMDSQSVFARETAVIGNRAYIALKSLRIAGLPQLDSVFTFSAEVMNYGNTPARDVTVQVKCDFLESVWEERPRVHDVALSGYVYSPNIPMEILCPRGEEKKFTLGIAKKYVDMKTFFYIYIHITYVDVFGEERFTDVCGYQRFRKEGFISAEKYNDTDYTQKSPNHHGLSRG